MALTKCIECGKEISTEAKVCPHCGTPKPHKSKIKKTLLIVGAIFLALVIIGSLSDKNKSTAKSDLTKAPTEAEKPLLTEEELKVYSAIVLDDILNMLKGNESIIEKNNVINEKPLVISSKAIQNEYEKNEVAGDQKFKNKLVAITGLVKSLDKTIGDKIVISLSGGSNMFMPPKAYMTNGYEDWVASLNKGDNVGLVCKVTGMTVGSVILNNCMPTNNWANIATESILKASSQGFKNNNSFFVELVGITKTLTAKLQPDSKCLTNGTNKECMTELSKITNTIKAKK